MAHKSNNVTNQSSNEAQVSSLDLRSSPTNFSYFPPRYGAAADIPYEQSFNLESIVHTQPTPESNDIRSLLIDNKTQQEQLQLSNSNAMTEIHRLLMDQSREHEKLMHMARKAQQDLINAMDLD